MSKAVKLLQDQILHKDEVDDRRINSHIVKAVDNLEKDLDKRLTKIFNQVEKMEEPIHAKFIDLNKETEGLPRQNLRFVSLYRECLKELQVEIKEKKQVLDTS